MAAKKSAVQIETVIGRLRLLRPTIPIVFDRNTSDSGHSRSLWFHLSVFRLCHKFHFGECYFVAGKFNRVSSFKKLDAGPQDPLRLPMGSRNASSRRGLLFSILRNEPQRSDLLNIDNYRNRPRVFAFASQPSPTIVAIHFNELESRRKRIIDNEEFSLAPLGV